MITLKRGIVSFRKSKQEDRRRFVAGDDLSSLPGKFLDGLEQSRLDRTAEAPRRGPGRPRKQRQESTPADPQQETSHGAAGPGVGPITPPAGSGGD